MTKKFADVLREAPEGRVQIYEEQFFRASDLINATTEDRALVRDHLFSRLEKGVTPELLVAIEGIGMVLEVGDAAKFVDALVRPMWEGGPTKDAAQSRLEIEYRFTSPEVDEKIAERLGEWATALEDRQHEVAPALRVLEQRYQIAADDDVPF